MNDENTYDDFCKKWNGFIQCYPNKENYVLACRHFFESHAAGLQAIHCRMNELAPASDQTSWHAFNFQQVEELMIKQFRVPLSCSVMRHDANTDASIRLFGDKKMKRSIFKSISSNQQQGSSFEFKSEFLSKK